jgi:hypothetical protein
MSEDTATQPLAQARPDSEQAKRDRLPAVLEEYAKDIERYGRTDSGLVPALRRAVRYLTEQTEQVPGPTAVQESKQPESRIKHSLGLSGPASCGDARAEQPEVEQPALPNDVEIALFGECPKCHQETDNPHNCFHAQALAITSRHMAKADVNEALVADVAGELETASALAFQDALAVARGCTDYGGGHHNDGHMEAFQHGIQTVITALEAAAKNPCDSQVIALRQIGTAQPPKALDASPLCDGQMVPREMNEYLKPTYWECAKCRIGKFNNTSPHEPPPNAPGEHAVPAVEEGIPTRITANFDPEMLAGMNRDLSHIERLVKLAGGGDMVISSEAVGSLVEEVRKSRSTRSESAYEIETELIAAGGEAEKAALLPVDLRLFGKVNLERCTASNGFGHALDSWSIAEWTNAMMGEGGEACNLAKKLLRHRDKVAGNYKAEDKDVKSLKLRTAKEICDAIIYADLAIQSLGFQTADLLVEVFNAKSEQLECPIHYDNRRVSIDPIDILCIEHVSQWKKNSADCPACLERSVRMIDPASLSPESCAEILRLSQHRGEINWNVRVVTANLTVIQGGQVRSVDTQIEYPQIIKLLEAQIIAAYHLEHDSLAHKGEAK